jgi:O-antigen/teichoic acid export membrane protein
VFPAYSSLQADPAKIRTAFLTVLRAVGGIAIPAAVGLALLAPEIVGVVYGPQWLPSSTPLRVLAMFGGARALGILSGFLYNALGKPRLSFYFSAAKLLVILAVIFPMTAHFGLTGAALAVAVPQILGDAIGLRFVQREIGLNGRALGAVLGRIGVTTAAMALAVSGCRALLSEVGGTELLILIAVGIVTYAVLNVGEMRSLYYDHVRRGLRPKPAVLPTPQA